MKRVMFGHIWVIVLVVTFFSTLPGIIGLGMYWEKTEQKETEKTLEYVALGYEKAGTGYLNALTGKEKFCLEGPDGEVLYQSGFPDDKFPKEESCYKKNMKDGNVFVLYKEKKSFSEKGKFIIGYTGVFFVFSMVLTYILTAYSTKRILRPIDEMDFEHRENGTIYRELKPLWKRLNQQDEEIERQMRELTKKQQEFVTITENMQEGLLVMNSRKEIISYNPAIVHFFGENLVSRIEGNLYLCENTELYEMLESAYLGQRNEKIVVEGNRKYQVIATPIKRETGIRGAVILAFDSTEKEERERLRQEFAANVSHELKTPLTSISGYAEIIGNGIAKEEDVKRFSDIIYEEAQRMISLVGDIIKLSNLDEKKLYSEKEETDIYQLADKILERLEDNAKKRQVHLQIEGEHQMVNGYPRLLEDMLQNLCDNGIKYNKEQGSVRVLIGKKSDRVFVSVSDTGIGIPKDDCERVFERFYRVDKSHSKEVGGTGLGLSIVKHSAMIHEAEISMESQEGVGTKIEILFPAIA